MRAALNQLVVCVVFLGSPWVAARQDSAPSAQETVPQREDELRRRVLSDFRDEIIAAKEALLSLQAASKQYGQEVTELLTSDAGKRIAKDPLAVMAFVQIRDEPLPAADQLSKKLVAIEEALKNVDARLARSRVEDLPTPSSRREVLDAHGWARARIDRVGERRDTLQSLIATTPGNGDVSQGPTLETAAKEYKNRFARFLNEGWQQGEARAAEKAKQTMTAAGEAAVLEQATAKATLELERVKAENERLRTEHEAELRRLREDQEKRLADLERELAVAKASRLKQEAETESIAKKGQDDADRIRRRQKCQDPEVKRTLAPFWAPGHYQIGKDIPDSEKRPHSYSLLKACGALQPTRDGLQALHTIATTPGDPDRPRWPYGGFTELSSQEAIEIRKAQDLLNELGEAMVELKMLLP